MAEQVHLYVYDLTGGMARALSPMLLGHQVEGVWHTSIVVHNVEWFFGFGVQKAVPESTQFGAPLQKQLLGSTEVPKDLVEDLVLDLGRTSFRPQDYNILLNNCNHFSHQLAQVLVGSGIPDHILTQHEVLLRSPMGQMLMPMIMQMEGQLGGATADGFGGGVATAATTSTITTTGTTTTATATTTTTTAATTTAAASAVPAPQQPAAAPQAATPSEEAPASEPQQQPK